VASRAGGDSHGRGFKMVEGLENPARSTTYSKWLEGHPEQPAENGKPLHDQL